MAFKNGTFHRIHIVNFQLFVFLFLQYSKSSLLMTCRSSPNSPPRLVGGLCLVPSLSPPQTATVPVGVDFVSSLIFCFRALAVSLPSALHLSRSWKYLMSGLPIFVLKADTEWLGSGNVSHQA